MALLPVLPGQPGSPGPTMPEDPRVPPACHRSADRRIDLRLPYPPAAVSYLLLAASFGLHPRLKRLPVHIAARRHKPSLHDFVLAAGSGSQADIRRRTAALLPLIMEIPGRRPVQQRAPSEAVYSPQPDVSSIPRGWRPRRSLADRPRLCSGRLTAEMQSLSGWRISL
jgi:hypothetical protein